MNQLRPLSAIAVAATVAVAGLTAREGVQSSVDAQLATRASGLVAGQVVDASTGRPVPDALVALRTPGSAVPRFVLTEPGGGFFFDLLAPGSYSILVSKSGYANATPPDLALVEGERATDVKIRLSKFGVISGVVTDEAGEPVVGVSVRILSVGMTGGQLRSSNAATATTDDRGAYRVATLPPGRYVALVPSTLTTMPPEILLEFARTGSPPPLQMFVVSGLLGSYFNQLVDGLVLQDGQRALTPPAPSDDGRIAVYPTTFHPAATASADATVVGLTSGEVRSGVDIRLPLLKTSAVSGIIIGPTGPVPHAAVRLSVAAPDDFGGLRGLETAIGIAGTDGRFTMLGVPAGRYILTTTVSLDPAPPVLDPAGQEVRPFLSATAPVTVGATEAPPLVINLQPALHVSGKVAFDGAGRRPDISALSKNPAVLITVADARNRGSFPAWTDNAFGFTTKGKTAGLVPGAYFIAPTPLPGWSFKSATLEGRDVSDMPFDLKADIDSIVVTYTDQPSALTGVVRGSRNAPDRDAVVIVFPTDTRYWPVFNPSGQRFRSAHADKAGAYSIPNLPAGEYFVIAATEPALADWQDAKVLDKLSRTATKVKISDGEKKTVDLRKAPQ
jgi:hypothetical protein